MQETLRLGIPFPKRSFLLLLKEPADTGDAQTGEQEEDGRLLLGRYGGHFFY